MILHKIADKIIFNILKRISVGYLEITSISGELLKFGKYSTSNRLCQWQRAQAQSQK